MSNHTTYDTPRQSSLRTSIAKHIEDETPRIARQGLVYYQQSLEASTEPSGAVPDSASLAGETSPIDSLSRPRRYAVQLQGPDGELEVDTHAARLARCSKRIHSWASALPWAPRTVRRSARRAGCGPRLVMLTLTYAKIGTWAPNQIRDYVVKLRSHLGDRLYAYAWVLEMQKRGAPHYHVLLWVKRGTDVPKPDAGMWNYGSSKRETARTPFYICKYTSKKKQKYYQKEGFPLGARMFAVKIYSQDVAPDDLFEFRISSVPSWLKPHLKEAYKHYGAELVYRRNNGGGWYIVQTGEVLYSPYSVLSVRLIQ